MFRLSTSLVSEASPPPQTSPHQLMFVRGLVLKTCLAMKLFFHPHIIIPFASLPNYSGFFFKYIYISVSSPTCISLTYNAFSDFHRTSFSFSPKTPICSALCFVVKMRARKTNVIRYSSFLRNDVFDIHKPFYVGYRGVVNNSNETSISPPFWCIVFSLCMTLDYTALSGISLEKWRRDEIWILTVAQRFVSLWSECLLRLVAAYDNS